MSSAAPPVDAATLTAEIVAPVLRPPGFAWIGAVLASAGLAGLFMLCVLMYCIEGYGIFGPDNAVNWGNDIASYIFWIGIAVAGTLVSSILFLFRQRWRTGINRATEAMTVFAINIAGIYPLIHTGRPWVDYWLIPHPNDLGFFPQFKSPIVWDVFAITGYATTSVLFFYLGLIPDFAAVRDRATRPWQKLLYGILAMGWRGTGSDWRHYERAYAQFAWIATPLVIGMHSTIATLLAVTQVPGWHSSVFPPYFVSGAIFGGLAMALLLLIGTRQLMGLGRYITVDHLEKLAKVMLGVGMVVLYVYLTEFFVAWYSEVQAEREQYLYRIAGDQAWAFWLMILCNVVTVQLLWFKRLRRHLGVLLLVGLAVNVGMWFERYNIIVLSLQHDHLPANWRSYAFTSWDYLILAGSFGIFLTQYLMFCKLAPVVSIAENKALLQREARHA